MMSSIKQIAIAAIVVSGILLYVVPGQQLATAQNLIDADEFTQTITDEVNQEIEQEAEQEAEQEQEQEQENEQEAEQSNEATVSQDETNEQANAIVTGDNTASVTQLGDNDAIGNEVEEQSVTNEAAVTQDSSADDNILSNENTFGDDVAIVDQDNILEQNALNVGIQEQDIDQDIDQEQLAANVNFDF